MESSTTRHLHYLLRSYALGIPSGGLAIICARHSFRYSRADAINNPSNGATEQCPSQYNINMLAMTFHFCVSYCNRPYWSEFPCFFLFIDTNSPYAS